MSLPEVNQRVMQALESSPEGLSDQGLLAAIGEAATNGMSDLLQSINQLLSEKRIQVFSSESGETLFKMIDQRKSERLRDLGVTETVVYELIASSESNGIWARDIRKRTGLQQQQISKILKVLENRSLVKNVTSVQGGRRKMYFLYELEPSSAVTGGSWFDSGEPDSEFVNSLLRYARMLAERNGSISVSELHQTIRLDGISTVDLTPDEVQQLVDTLVYDGILEKPIRGGLSYTFNKAHDRLGEQMAQVPCTRCTVVDLCFEGGQISPQTCEYMKDWLDEF